MRNVIDLGKRGAEHIQPAAGPQAASKGKRTSQKGKKLGALALWRFGFASAA